MTRKHWWWCALSGVLVMAACSGLRPDVTDFGLGRPSAAKNHSPEPGKALVIFFHPYLGNLLWRGHALPPPVFRVVGDDEELIGFLDLGNKVAYQAPPGHQLFMIDSVENVDFMDAELVAGKTYYAAAAARTGNATDRYSLLPIRGPNSQTEPFKEWGHVWSMGSDWWKTVMDEENSAWTEVSPNGSEWFKTNHAKLDEKRRRFYQKWTARSAAEKVHETMMSDDGV